MAPLFNHVAIIGVGLIGGSLGLVLRSQGLANSVVGIGRRVENLKLAVELGAIDHYVVEAEAGVRGADLVLLATPVASYRAQVESWKSCLGAGTLVSDVGSVKGSLVEELETRMPPGVEFVGAHPIAGKERTGVGAGSVDLFQGATCIVTPTERTRPSSVKTISHMWEMAGMKVMSMDPYLHDKILGAVSHLPHVAAFSLMTALEDIETELGSEFNLLSYGGGGLRDTTRIAGSSPEMWRDICVWNKDNVVKMIESYERQLARFKRLVQAGDSQGLEREMERARQLRARVQ